MIANNPTFTPTMRQNFRRNVKNFLRRNPRVLANLNALANDQLGFTTTNQPTFGSGIINTGSSSGTGKFETIFNGVLGIGSQIISGWGKNQTTQISANNGQVQALPTPYGSAGTTTAQQQAIAQAQAQAAANNGGAGAKAVDLGTSFFDGLAESFGVNTSTLMLFGIAGAYLLFRTPPKSR